MLEEQTDEWSERRYNELLKYETKSTKFLKSTKTRRRSRQ